MSHFRGHKTGFNPSGSNDCDPNELGPPTTKFGGRSAVPAGPLKRYPGATADISSGNRRLAKSGHGDGGGAGTSYGGHPSGFRMEGGPTGKSSKTYYTGGGKGYGTNKK